MKKSILTALVIPALIGAGPAGATLEEAEFLKLVAEQYILAQFRDDPSPSDTFRITATAGQIDPTREYGGKCPGYLTAELRGTSIRTSSSVRITCRDPKHSYTINVPVTVRREVLTVVPIADLKKGATLGPDDLQAVWMDQSRAGQLVVSNPKDLVGSKLRRDVRAGEPLKQAQICIVSRGDRVNIEVLRGGLHLKTDGIAMDDGNVGESIRVKNSRTGKIVEAVIAGPGEVTIAI